VRMTRFSTRLRTRLVVIALMAVVPAVAAVVYSQTRERRHVREHIVSENLRRARSAASQQAQVIDGARRLLLTLAKFPELQTDNVEACQALLPKILRDHPGYANMIALNPDGTLFCAGVPFEPRMSAQRRDWFRQAIATRNTSIGGYQISPTTGRPDIVVAQPLLGPTGSVVRVLAAGIGVDQLNLLATETVLPPGATIVLFDRTRTILARVPDGARWVGKKVPDTAILERLSTEREDLTEGVGVDGVQRLYVAVPVQATVDSGLYVGMGIDRAAAFAESDDLLRELVWMLAFVSLAAIGGALVGGDIFVVRPLMALSAVSRKYSGSPTPAFR
jgi:hypothetical protein